VATYQEALATLCKATQSLVITAVKQALRPALDGEPDLDPIRGGFGSLVGFRLVDWDLGSARIVLDVREKHLNRSGVVHGGVIATMLDAVGGYAGLYCTVPGNVRTCLTISLSQLFVAPGLPPRIEARARQLSTARSTFFAEAAAYDAEGALIGSAQGVYRWARGSEVSEGTKAEETS
jgi:uncharacterized protein (TIGR00369 family)